MKVYLKIIASIGVATLFMMGCYATGNFIGTKLGEWIMEE